MNSTETFNLKPKKNFFRTFAKTICSISANVSERELWIVGFSALLIYLPGIFWGLPYATHSFGTHSWEIDAVTGMQTLSELHNLFIEPKPDWYVAYPPFHYIIVGIFYTPYLGFLYLTGDFTQPATVYPFGLKDPVTVLENLTLIGRKITVLMASGVVLNAYLTARTVWDKQTARLTAIAVALPTTMVFYARTGNLEIPMMFWISLTILLLARCLSLGFTVRRAFALGIFAALSVATKDSAYGVLSIGLIFLVIYFWRGKIPNIESNAKWKAPLMLFISGLSAYLLASGILISPQRFFAHLEFVRNFDKTFYNVIHLNLLRPATPSGYAVLMGDVAQELLFAIGPVLLVVGIIGLAATWRTTIFTKILSLMSISYILLVIVPVRHMQYRYIIVPAFILAFFIARAFVLGMRDRRKWLTAATLSAMIIGFGWIGLRAIDLTYQMIFDSRYEAGIWLENNAVKGDEIAFSSVQNILPPIQQGITAVQLIDDPSFLEKLQQKQFKFVLVQADWSSSIGDEHSYFFPKNAYEYLNDVNSGYEKAAEFKTEPLFRGFGLDFPLVTPGYIVNPPVKIYQLTTQ